ncbi:ribonucleoprotein PTB-binding 1 isoform X2 [Brienomyrus brachyistius]|uniref:ribonucleoprotein PTB-binding 1 isoform X2 n=1 Tax=Brienomyrus brachyistius TaxID=42636 RepID=UPI0020B44260|nr:ribonucleoprotein PTB-binding 1 isoform X2 [Brienomyrus brachyistius]
MSGRGSPTCVLFKLLKPFSPFSPIETFLSLMMAAAVSVGSAVREQNPNAVTNFSTRPPYGYDAGAGREDWTSDEVREPERKCGHEDASVAGECPRRVEEELPALSPEEIESRLEKTRREFYNRRKIIIKNLPADITNQEVHELLSGYDLKYCFVDKYKGTAFVTLLNGEQAQSSIKEFHQQTLREREISVQLQPTDTLLCVANLPRSLTQLQFEELVRPFGNLERCFLVHGTRTGHSKGYGFVEYMKKDSAARAKSELLGKQLGSRTLYVHWSEAGTLTYPLLHSRCLCVDRLPHSLLHAQDLRQALADTHMPVFCELAQGQDGSFRRFAVLEFATPEMAEEVQRVADGRALGGTHIRVSFCAPGPPGRSMLAALIAAQTMALNRGKGLLPEPTAMQILTGLNNPAALKMLLAPLSQGFLGPAPAVPLLANPALSAALLQMLLQNQAQIQQTGMLGDGPLVGVQSLQPAMSLLGDLPTGGAMLPPICLPSDPPGPIKPPAPSRPLLRDLESPAVPCGLPPTSSPALQGLTSPLLGSLLGGEGTTSGASLLGEPPKEVPLAQNPFLNMQSLFPSGGASSRPHPYKKKAGNLSQMRGGPSSGFGARYQDIYSQHSEYTAVHQDPLLYPYEPMSMDPNALPGFGQFPQHPGHSDHPLYTYPPSPPYSTYFSSSAPAPRTAQLNKAVGMPPLAQPTSLYQSENVLKTPVGAHKRLFSRLIPSPEPSPEGGYVGQHSQGLGGHYADSYLKRKRIF